MDPFFANGDEDMPPFMQGVATSVRSTPHPESDDDDDSSGCATAGRRAPLTGPASHGQRATTARATPSYGLPSESVPGGAFAKDGPAVYSPPRSLPRSTADSASVPLYSPSHAAPRAVHSDATAPSPHEGQRPDLGASNHERERRGGGGGVTMTVAVDTSREWHASLSQSDHFSPVARDPTLTLSDSQLVPLVLHSSVAEHLSSDRANDSTRSGSAYLSPTTHAFAVEFGRHHTRVEGEVSTRSANVATLLEAPLSALGVHSTSAMNSLPNEESLLTPSLAALGVAAALGESASQPQLDWHERRRAAPPSMLVPTVADEPQLLKERLEDAHGPTESPPQPAAPLSPRMSSSSSSAATSVNSSPPLGRLSAANLATVADQSINTAPAPPSVVSTAPVDDRGEDEGAMDPAVACASRSTFTDSQMEEDSSSHLCAAGACPAPRTEPTGKTAAVSPAAAARRAAVPPKRGHPSSVGASSVNTGGSLDTVLARLHGLVPANTVSGDARGTDCIEKAAALTAAAAALTASTVPRALQGPRRAARHQPKPSAPITSAAPPPAVPHKEVPCAPPAAAAARQGPTATLLNPLGVETDGASDSTPPLVLSARTPKALVSPAVPRGAIKTVLLPTELETKRAHASATRKGGQGGAADATAKSGEGPAARRSRDWDETLSNDRDAPPRLLRTPRKSTPSLTGASPTRATDGRPRTTGGIDPAATRIAMGGSVTETARGTRGTAVCAASPGRWTRTVRRLMRVCGAAVQRVSPPTLRWLMAPFVTVVLLAMLGALAVVSHSHQGLLWAQLTDVHGHLHGKAAQLLLHNGVLTSIVPDTAAMVLETAGHQSASAEVLARRLCATVARHMRHQHFPVSLSYVSGLPDEPIAFCASRELQPIDERDSATVGPEGRQAENVFVRLLRDEGTGLYNGLYAVDEHTFTPVSPLRLVELFPGRRPYTESEVLRWLGFKPREVERNMSCRAHAANASAPTIRVRHGTELYYTRSLVEQPHPARGQLGECGVVSHIRAHVAMPQLLLDAEHRLFDAQVDQLRTPGAYSAVSERPMLRSSGVVLAASLPHGVPVHLAPSAGSPISAQTAYRPSETGTNGSFSVRAQEWVMDAARGIFPGEPMTVSGSTGRTVSALSAPHGPLLAFHISPDYLDYFISRVPTPSFLLPPGARQLGWWRTRGLVTTPVSSRHHTASTVMDSENRSRRDAPTQVTVHWRSHKVHHHTTFATSAAELVQVNKRLLHHDTRWRQWDVVPAFFTIVATPPELAPRPVRHRTLWGAVIIGLIVAALSVTVLVQDVLIVLCQGPLQHASWQIERAEALIDRPWMGQPMSASSSDTSSDTDADKSLRTGRGWRAPFATPSRGRTRRAGCRRVHLVHPSDADEEKEDTVDVVPLNTWLMPLLSRVQVSELARLGVLCARMYNRTEAVRQFLPEYFFPPARSGAHARMPPALCSRRASSGSSSAVDVSSSSCESLSRRSTPHTPTNNTARTARTTGLDAASRQSLSLPLPPGADREADRQSPPVREPRGGAVLPVLTTVEVPAALRVVSRSPPAQEHTSPTSRGRKSPHEVHSTAVLGTESTCAAAAQVPVPSRRAVMATLPVVLQTHAGTLSESMLSRPSESGQASALTRTLDLKTSWYAQCFCSTISLHHEIGVSQTATSPEMSRFMELVVDMVDKYNVNTDILCPEMVSLSVGSRTIVKDHALVATRCALELFRGVPHSIQRRTTVVVDSGIFHYGVCGVPQHRGFVLWGRPSAELFFEQQKTNAMPFLVTDTVAPLIQAHYRLLPIDAIQIVEESKNSHIILYALYEGSAKSAAWTDFATRYTEAFVALAARRFAPAASQLEQLLSSPLFPLNGTMLYALAVQHSLRRSVRHGELSCADADAAFRRMLTQVRHRIHARHMAVPFGQGESVLSREPIFSWTIPFAAAFLDEEERAQVPIARSASASTETSLNLWAAQHGSSPSMSSLTNGTAEGPVTGQSPQSTCGSTGSAESVVSPGPVTSAQSKAGWALGLPAASTADVVWVFDPVTTTGTLRSLPATGTRPSSLALVAGATEASSRLSTPDSMGKDTTRNQPLPRSRGDAVTRTVVPADHDAASAKTTARTVSGTTYSSFSCASSASPFLRKVGSTWTGSTPDGADWWAALPDALTDLNGNVWRRGRVPAPRTSVEPWTCRFRGLSVTGSMVDLAFYSTTDADDPSSASPPPLSPLPPSTSTAADPVVATAQVADAQTNGSVSRDSLHYMEIVCEAFFHENIQQLLSVSLVPGLPYLCLVLAYEPGETVLDLVQQYERSLPRAVIYNCSASILRGLDFLHTDKGSIHGALSPKNVIVGTDGQCKLRGMAYLLGWASSNPSHQAQLGHVLDVPYYLSPEVLLGAPKDAASDMYAFGLVLLSMLTGGLPWTWAGLHYGTLPRRSKDDLLTVLMNRELFAQSLTAGDIVLCAYGPQTNAYCRDLQSAYGQGWGSSYGDISVDAADKSSSDQPTQRDAAGANHTRGPSSLSYENTSLVYDDLDAEGLAQEARAASVTGSSAVPPYDEVLLQVLEACLALDPSQRKTAPEVLHMLESSLLLSSVKS